MEFMLIVAALAVFYLVPAVLLWQRRARIGTARLALAGLALTFAPVLGNLVAWYIALTPDAPNAR